VSLFRKKPTESAAWQLAEKFGWRITPEGSGYRASVLDERGGRVDITDSSVAAIVTRVGQWLRERDRWIAALEGYPEDDRVADFQRATDQVGSYAVKFEDGDDFRVYNLNAVSPVDAASRIPGLIADGESGRFVSLTYEEN
jgi:hypothetical protein